MAAELNKIIAQVEALTTEEQLRLVAYLAERVSRVDETISTRQRQWCEIAGVAPDLMQGEDAQAWITRTRREADEIRETQR